MTRDELIETLEHFRECRKSVDDMIEAVDAYSEAIMAQSQCSTLREFVGQKLDQWVEADVDELGKYGQWKRDYMVDAYSELLKFIDAQKPVA